MNPRRLRLIAAAALACASAPASADFSSKLQSGNWTGGAWVDDQSKEFRNCGLSLRFNAGTILTLLVNASHQINVIVADPRITAAPQSRFETVARFEPAPEYKAQAIAVRQGSVQFSLPAFPDAYDQVRNATKFHLNVPGLATNLDVTGMSAALPMIYQCLATERMKMNLPPTPAGQNPPLDRMEAAMFGLATAERAGIAPYIVFPDAQRPKNFEKPLSLWGMPGVAGPDGPANVLGQTHSYAPVAGDTLAKAMEARKATIRNFCNDGSLELADLPAIAGKDAMGAGLSCRGTYEEIYLIRRRDGALIEIGLAGPPGKRKTVEAVGAKYRAAIAALLP